VLVVPSVVLDLGGQTAPGRVTRKHEDIRIMQDGGWQRTLQVAVATARSDAIGLQPMVGVDQARFDRLRVGDSVRVRYVECCPIFARLADRTTLDWVRDITPEAVYELRWMVWLVGGIGFLVFAGRYGVGFLLAAALAWGAAALALDRGTRRPAPADGTARAPARVREVRRIEYALATRRSSDFELRLPYDVAVLAFVPAAGADTVVAVDAVDAESVRGLATDSTVRVRFDPAAPRTATIDGGSRTYYDANRPLFIAIVGGTFAAATLVGVLASSRTARRRRR